MRSFTFFPLVGLLIASVSTVVHAATIGGAGCTAEICGEPLNPVARALEPTSATVVRKHLTNAERLARGLPPMPPTRRMNAARQDTSPIPKATFNGKIEVKRADTGAILGFLKTTFSGTMVTTTAEQATKFSASVNLGKTSGSQLRVTILQPESPELPLLGLVQGRSNANADLSPNSFHFTYIGAVALIGTPPGSPPVNIRSGYSVATGMIRAAETDIWTIDFVSGAMSPQWINTDSSEVQPFIFVQSDTVYAGGNPLLFYTRQPMAGVTTVSFKWVLDAV